VSPADPPPPPSPPTPPEPDRRLFSPAVQRNRAPILAVLERVLPARGLVLEIASGSGEHAAFLAPRLPGRDWQPSDPDPRLRASIAGHAARAGAANLRPSLDLDVRTEPWPLAAADAVVAINLIHIAPWAVAEALFSGAARILTAGAALYLYGPYRREGRHTAPGNAAFDAGLRAQNPAWGVRDLEAVAALARDRGFAFEDALDMPANNLSVIFRRG